MSLINQLFQLMTGHSRSHRRQPFSPFGPQAAQVEVLENRRLLSALTVTSAADSGAGSLRAEIADANSGDTINFASSLKGQTITLTGGELLINKGLTIQGPGAGQLTISGGNTSRVFDVNSSQAVVLTGLTISNGRSGQGAGIYDASGSNLTVSVCTISNCHAGWGGGIYNHGGSLTLSLCTISGDSAFYNLYSASGGGGIYNYGRLTADGCTLSGDSATLGGGIYVFGGEVALTNCTIAENFANGATGIPNLGLGGGIYSAAPVSGVIPSCSLTNCTVSLNQAKGMGGGIFVPLSNPPATVGLINTIVAGNTVYTAAGYSEHNLGADIWGHFAVDHSLIGNNNNPWGQVINAMLGPLQNNGGPTMTMALLAGSPAIGGSPVIVHADNAKAPLTDQRGVTRLDEPGELTDIGAYEV
jgi:hypothetical protein